MLPDNHILQKTNVTLKMLLDAKILAPGLALVCTNPDIHGILNNDGSITVSFNKEEKIFSHLSGAARHIEKRNLNGWMYWSVVIENEKHPLSDFRDQYFK